jgi:hypothetical protein
MAAPPPPAAAQHRADWLKQARWGVMTHYLPDWIDPQRSWTSDAWNALVDGFDAEGIARQLQEVGAGYHLVSLGQNSGFYLAPNPTYDRLVGQQPGRCSRRDLVADLHQALAPRRIRLLVYLPSGAPDKDRAAVAALEWQRGHHRNREFLVKWEQVVRDWSSRWGPKVSGWWFDGCYWPNAMYRSPEPPNFASLAAAARSGNPASIVAFNHGVYHPIVSISDQEDFTAGEINDPERDLVKPRRLADGRSDGVQLHMLSHLGATWGRGAPRFTAAQVLAHTRKVLGYGGAVTWDVPVQRNGLISEAFLDQLRALRDGLRAEAASPAPAATPRP